MKYALTVLIFILIFAFAVSAQTNQNSSCPSVDISGGGVAKPGETVWFTANVFANERDLKIEYVWTVSSGQIISGQGTQIIGVIPPLNENLTVTLEVKGFPEGCSNIVSDTLGCALKPPEPIKVGEFLNFATQNDKDQLKELKKEIADDPSAQVYVIGRFKKNSSDREAAQKLKKTGAYLMKELTLDADRITMIKVFGESEYTEIWLVPAGAFPPTPQN